jgi:hypothetical protein
VPVPITNALDGPKKLKHAEAFLKTIREAVGDDIDILLDLHGRLTPQIAIQYGERFEPYNPFFLEEPVQAENPKAMAPVARALSTPIATGERLFLRWASGAGTAQGSAASGGWAHPAADQARPGRRGGRSRMRQACSGLLDREGRRHGDALLPRDARGRRRGGLVGRSWNWRRNLAQVLQPVTATRKRTLIARPIESYRIPGLTSLSGKITIVI